MFSFRAAQYRKDERKILNYLFKKLNIYANLFFSFVKGKQIYKIC